MNSSEEQNITEKLIIDQINKEEIIGVPISEDLCYEEFLDYLMSLMYVKLCKKNCECEKCETCNNMICKKCNIRIFKKKN